MKNGKLRPYQKTEIKKALVLKKYGLYFDTGTGKTITALEIIDRVAIERPDFRWLVITPKSVIESWLVDAGDYFPHLQIATLARYKKAGYFKKLVKDIGHADEVKPSLKGIKDYIHKEFQIVIVNPEQVAERYKWKIDKRGKKRKSKNSYHRANVDWRLFDGIMVDESAMMRSGDSAITNTLIRASDAMDYIYLLSGTPAPNDAFEFWGQMRCIFPELLGKSNYQFKQKFGYQDKFKSWHLRANSEEKILEIIKPRCVFIEKRDVLKDLPPLTEIVRYTVESKVSKDNRYKIQDLLKEGGFNIGHLAKLRTMASGFLYEQDVVTGERIGTIIHNDDKINTLHEILGEIGDHKVIIWVQFDADIDRVLNITGRNQTAIATGRTKNLQKELSWFKGEFPKRCKYLIAHPLSIGEGVNGLQSVCNICVFYNFNHSYDRYYQALSRLERSGQLHAMTVFIIITMDSIEVDMWEAVQRKQKFQDFVREKLGIKN